MASKSPFAVPDEAVVPRGIVHSRMKEFEQESHNRSHYDSPSCSYVTPTDILSRPQSSGRTHIVVGCRPTIREHLSEEDLQIERNIIIRRETIRSLDGEPHITIQQSAHRSRSKSPRSYPVVTVNVTDPEEKSKNFAQSAFPPNELYSTVIPVKRRYGSTPNGPATKRAIQVEQSDELSRNYKPRQDYRYRGDPQGSPVPLSTAMRVISPEVRNTEEISIYRNPIHAGPMGDSSVMEEEDLGMETDEEVRQRMNELNQAKQTIRDLALELARLERDKKMLEINSSLSEEKADANVASSVADLIEHMRTHSDQYYQEEMDQEQQETDFVDVDQIASECQRMLTTLRENEREESTDEERNYQRFSPSYPMGLHSMTDREDRRPSTSSDSSQILSLKEQSVAYSSSGNIQTSLISRLERELTDAQTTNHRLNAQLGNLVSSGNSTLKKEMQELKRDLKLSRDENDQLKKKLQKAERDRQQWDTQKKTLESKLPIDVQLLMAQKRELTMQLDREQNEKHELFLQINSMIAQLADSGDVDRIKEENRVLKKKLDESEMISSSETSRFKDEARKLQDQMDITKRTFELEKRKLQSDTEELRKELNMKAAALQSLMLAKQDSGKMDKLAEENRLATEKLESLKEELEEREQIIQDLESQLSSSSSIGNEVERLKKDMERTREEVQNERTEKQTLSKSIDELNRKLSSFESSSDELNSQLKEKQKRIEEIERMNKELQDAHVSESESLRHAASQKSDESTELQQKINILETTLREKDTKIDATKVSLFAAESKAVQAESDLKNMDQQLKNSERRALQLESQLAAAGDGEKEVGLLREQLHKAEERYEILMNRQQKAESSHQELAQSLRAEISKLEAEVADAERENTKTEEIQRKKAVEDKEVSQQISTLNAKLKTLEDEKQTSERKIGEMEKQLKENEAERKKLESKASVADELTTLVSSLQAVRSENGQYQDEIASLHTELSEIREDRDQIQEESAEWQRKAEQLEGDREKLQKAMHVETQRISELTKEKEQLESAESERQKLETLMEAMEITSRDLVKGISEKEKQIAELTSKSEGKAREMREELDALKAKLETSQKRNTDLEDERNRVIGSGDEEKQRLHADITTLRESADASHVECETLKSKLISAKELCTSHEEKEKQLEERLKILEKEYEDAKSAAAASSADSACKSRETERMGEKIKLQLEELEREKREEIRILEEEVRENKMKVEGAEKEIQQLRREKETVQMEKKQEGDREMEDVREKLSDVTKRAESAEKTRDELISQMKTMTSLMEEEAKRIEELIEEKKRLQEKLEEAEKKLAADRTPELDAEISRLSAEILRLQSEHEKTQEESKKQSTKVLDEQIAVLHAEKSKLSSDLHEAKTRAEEAEKKLSADKTPELKAEITRLSAEILRLQSQLDQSQAESKKQSTKALDEQILALNTEKTKLSSDLQEAKTRVEQLNRSIVSAEKKKKDELAAIYTELGMVKDERARLQDKIDHMYVNGSTGTQRTVSNMSFTSNYTMADFSEIDDVDILRGQIDKQKRLIIVLRRKLQGLQPRLP